MTRSYSCTSPYLVQVLLAIVTFLAAVPDLARAEPYQSSESIYIAVKDFIAAQLPGQSSLTEGSPAQIEVGALDSRLRLAECEIPLETFLPPGNQAVGNTSVGVRCQGARPWLLYLPVTVKAFGEAVVAARPLARDAHLAEGDVRLMAVDLAQLPADYLADPQQAVGMTLKRPLANGVALGLTMLQAPRVVRRNEHVTILAEVAGLEVRMEGQALADGASGQVIRVRNSLSKRVIEGTIIGPGIVKVPM